VAKSSKKAPTIKKAARPTTKAKTAPRSGSKPSPKAAARTTMPAKVAASTRTASKAAPRPVAKATTKSRPTPTVTRPAAAAPSAKNAAPVKNAVAVKSAAPGKNAAPAKVAPAGKSSNGKPPRPEPQIIPRPQFGTKPGKNQAGLSTKELEVFRDLLLQKRRELVGDMYSMEREALQRGSENLSNLPLHMADMGTDNYEQEFTLGLMEKDRQLLREINAALSKIVNGTYGICEGTGKPISKVRLEVQPWAKYSIEHARKLENRGVR
jgi:RNA polymerase-binding protein DksA